MEAVALDRDAQAIALLCSRLALPRDGGPRPLGPAEWNQLAATLRSTGFGRPGDLLGLGVSELSEALPIGSPDAERIQALLSRGVQLAIELERLASRGIWLLTRADDNYPSRLKKRLRGDAPPLFYGAGSRSLLEQGGVAVVGSRDADASALGFARDVGRICAKERLPVVSGAARGVDITAMLGSVDAGGTAVGFAAEALEKLVRRRELREPLADGTLVIISPHNPDARFHVGNAMRRNRLIYCAADVAVVVASTAERGGTRAGALEALKSDWVPVLVRDDGSGGNNDLLRRGASAVTDAGQVLIVPHHGRSASLLDVAGDDPYHRPEEPEHEGHDSPKPDDGGDGEPLKRGTAGQRVPDEPAAAVSASDSSDSSDLFEAVWPVLAKFLSTPRSETDVADHFALQRGQTRAWLQRAVKEELLYREGRAKRYVLAARQESFDVT